MNGAPLVIVPSRQSPIPGITLDTVIERMEATNENQWCTDVVRTKDGAANCFFGHLFEMGGSDRGGNLLWDWFENEWSTTYAVYPVNDGENPKFPQPTPKQRVIAYLRALSDGTEQSTQQSMEASYQRSLQPSL